MLNSGESKLPIGLRPGMAGASLSARLDAVFGALGGTLAAAPTPGSQAATWSLKQDVQPFQVSHAHASAQRMGSVSA